MSEAALEAISAQVLLVVPSQACGQLSVTKKRCQRRRAASSVATAKNFRL